MRRRREKKKKSHRTTCNYHANASQFSSHQAGVCIPHPPYNSTEHRPFWSFRQRLGMRSQLSLKFTQLCAAFLFIVQISRFECYKPPNELDRIRIANLTKLLFPKVKPNLRISAKEDSLPCLHFDHELTDNDALKERRLPSLFHTVTLNTIKKFSGYNFITGNLWKLKTCNELFKLSNSFARKEKRGSLKQKLIKKANNKKSEGRLLRKNIYGSRIHNRAKHNHIKLNEFAGKSWLHKERGSDINMSHKSIDVHSPSAISQRQEQDISMKIVSARESEDLNAKNLPRKTIAASASEPLSRYMRRRISKLENEDEKYIQGQEE